MGDDGSSNQMGFHGEIIPNSPSSGMISRSTTLSSIYGSSWDQMVNLGNQSGNYGGASMVSSGELTKSSSYPMLIESQGVSSSHLGNYPADPNLAHQILPKLPMFGGRNFPEIVGPFGLHEGSQSHFPQAYASNRRGIDEKSSANVAQTERGCQVDFGITPLICGIAASIWLRFVASTRVFADDWADKTIMDSETGEKRRQVGKHCLKEHRNMHKERMVIIWIRSLKKTIPLSCSLAVSFLACHIAKEPVLPTDIIKWSIEGKLPYFGAFPKIAESILQIERYHQHALVVCPLKASSMFKPKQLPLQKLESMAASIAQSVGLNLPPVNFYRIAYRYLKQLSLPVEKILPYACRIQEWSMPPDLWLSASEEKLPSRVCVMSILIVTIRILYNLNGFGKWESTLSPPIVSSKDGQAASFEKSNAKKGAEEASTNLGGEPETNLSSVHKFESGSTELFCATLKRNTMI